MEAQQLSDKPNVLIIMVDDLNDNIGILGGHAQTRTPYMDAFAKSATTFSQAYTNAPMCGPSRASMFTGIYPHHSNNYFQNPWYDYKVLNNSRTMMEQFKEHKMNYSGQGASWWGSEPAIITSGKGRYLISQLWLLENLGKDTVADKILFNMINFLAMN